MTWRKNHVDTEYQGHLASASHQTLSCVTQSSTPSPAGRRGSCGPRGVHLAPSWRCRHGLVFDSALFPAKAGWASPSRGLALIRCQDIRERGPWAEGGRLAQRWLQRKVRHPGLGRLLEVETPTPAEVGVQAPLAERTQRRHSQAQGQHSSGRWIVPQGNE